MAATSRIFLPDFAVIVLCGLAAITFVTAEGENSVETCPPAANMTKGCTCDESEFAVQCINASLTSFPMDLPNGNSLTVRYNPITVVEMVPYNHLVYLYLDWNKIGLVQNDAFVQLRHLKVLSLAHNNLGAVEFGTFAGLNSLEMLVMEGNPIHAVLQNTFSGQNLPNLEVLKLSYCDLYAIKDNALASLANLKVLNTSHNNLLSMPVLGCPNHSLHKFHTWDLSHNQIAKVEGLHCSHMIGLTRLYLGFNNITSITESSLVGARTSLRDLVLRGNKISYIDSKAFASCKHLMDLDISFNALTNLSEDTIAWQRMDKLLVHDNPWYCGCENSWLVDEALVIQGNLDATLRCASPPEVAGQGVYDVKPSYFNSCITDHQRQVRIAIGVIMSVCILIAVTLIIYHQVTKRKAHQAISRGKSLGGTPSYQRMQTEADLAFSIDDEREGDELANGMLSVNHSDQAPITARNPNTPFKI